MKLNNKGMTLVEIIISVALISIVLVFLFTLLIQVNNENSDNEVRSSYLINQSAFTKQVEEDFLSYELKKIALCEDGDIESTSSDENKLYLPNLFSDVSNSINIKCLKFEYSKEITTPVYLFIYKRVKNSSFETVLSYYRGEFKQSVVLEDFVWDDKEAYVKEGRTDFSGQTVSGSAYNASLPIIGPDGNDYSINLSYYKE